MCLTLDPSDGGGLWAADTKGSMFLFMIDNVSGHLQRSKRFNNITITQQGLTNYLYRIVVANNVPITSISCRSWISREARDPSLLLSCADNTLRLYRCVTFDLSFIYKCICLFD